MPIRLLAGHGKGAFASHKSATLASQVVGVVKGYLSDLMVIEKDTYDYGL